MSRSETTAMLSKLVEKRLSSRCQIWGAEVSFDLSTGHDVRVDYMGFKPHAPGGIIGASSVELGTFDAYEVKSCMADFNSGHGLNFIGDRNYLVCTRELAEQLRGNIIGVDAVLVPDKPRNKLITCYELGNYGSHRSHPASEMLWQIVKAHYTQMGGAE